MRATLADARARGDPATDAPPSRCNSATARARRGGRRRPMRSRVGPAHAWHTACNARAQEE